MSGHDDAFDARQQQIEAEERALREAMIEAGARSIAENNTIGCAWEPFCQQRRCECRARAASALEASGALDLAAAVLALLRRHDEENPGEAFAPDAGCLDCTAGQTPTKWQTSTCPHHRIKAILGRLKP